MITRTFGYPGAISPLVHAVFFLVMICSLRGEAKEDFQIDPELQMILGNYMEDLQREQIGQREILKDFLEKASGFKISKCLFIEWLKTVDPAIKNRNGRLDLLLGDKIDGHQRVVEETYDYIAGMVDAKPRATGRVDEQIQDLAIKIAANQDSLRTIKTNVIPKLQELSTQNLREIRSIDAKIRVLDLTYRAEFELLCERVARLEREVQLFQERGQVQPATWDKPAFNSNGEIRSINYEYPTQQRWQPDAYVSSTGLCPRAVLKESNYTYYARVHTPDGIITRPMHGDIYINCGGKVVMVLR